MGIGRRAENLPHLRDAGAGKNAAGLESMGTGHGLSRLRPFALLALITALPALVEMRTRKP
jgi:hypothetical protein